MPLYEELYARGAYAPEAERRRLAELVRREEGSTWPSRFADRADVEPGGALRGAATAPAPEEVQTSLF
jgi:hypothetical protein